LDWPWWKLCEVPVIATAVGGAPEILQHGITGWLVKKSDTKSISEALKIASDLPMEELILMGKISRKSVEGRFNPKDYIKKLEAIYNSELQKL
jgi:glycosyltransferase involved in cell wall biosynthesis